MCFLFDMRKVVFIAVLLLSHLSAFASTKVILKLDDLSVKNGKCACLPTMNWLFDNGIPSSFGIIPAKCDTTLYSTLQRFILNYRDTSSPIIEFWHHGLDHSRIEFSETGYEFQSEHFDKADSLMLAYTGIQMKTFGAPYNQVDRNTVKAIKKNSNYRYLFFVPEDLFGETGLVLLNDRVNMENGTGNVNFEFFKKNYLAAKDEIKDYMVLQCHPNNWGEEKLTEFKNIIRFLIDEGCEFILPSKYGE